MKRSEINAVIKKFEALLDEHKFLLPPYLNFTPEEWKIGRASCRERV